MSQSQPPITVVTVSLNQGRFLEQCIRSVLDQRYLNLEYIIVDGGSTDGSVGIIERYQEHLSYWISEPDDGQADAINKGFARATGDVVAWLNSDDFYLPGALQEVAAAFAADSNASFFFGNGLRVDEAGQPLGQFFPGDRLAFSEDALAYGLNYILQPAAFINRKRMAAVGGLDARLHYGLDTDLWIRLARAAPPRTIDARLAASREYGSTKTARGSFRRVEELRQVAEKHTGVPMTPGALCYFLETLRRLSLEREDVYPESFRLALDAFWSATAGLFPQYGARAEDGFPSPPVVESTPPPPPAAAAVRKPIWTRVWRSSTGRS